MFDEASNWASNLIHMLVAEGLAPMLSLWELKTAFRSQNCLSGSPVSVPGRTWLLAAIRTFLGLLGLCSDRLV
jgi:hypothetical protein